jgi:hypothetical protein
MRILFIVMPDRPPSTRIRVLELIPPLADHNIVFRPGFHLSSDGATLLTEKPRWIMAKSATVREMN